MKLSLLRLFTIVLGIAAVSCGAAGVDSEGRDAGSQKKDRSRERVAVEENLKGGYGEPEVLARLDDKSLDESSGLVASRANRDILWTHNDSGDRPLIYAFDTQGRVRGVWQVAGARIYDWEDIAIGPGPQAGRAYLYVGDIGDNSVARRQIIVYRFPEPAVTDEAAESDRRRPLTTEPAEAIRLRYPDGAHDAETLMVHPRTGDIYIVTKVPVISAAVYKLKAPYSTTGINTLERVGEFAPPTLAGGLITGGDISADGRRVALCDYANGYEFRLPPGAADFDAIWRQPAKKFSLGQRDQGEAIAYSADATAIFATSEGKRPPLIRVSIPE